MASTLAVALVSSLLFIQPGLADGLYTKSSPVLQVSGSNYDDLIVKSNYTSIVEFYAPWCGHCKNLQPVYEKAAKSLSGLAKVAAVNCDEESNKPFCGSMGVKGFPTLKIVKPGKKAGRPIVDDYNGERTAKAIVDAVTGKIVNHVARLKDDDYADWLDAGDAPKAILFSEKGTTSSLLKAIAIEFLGGIDVAQIRSKEDDAVEKFDVQRFPTLVLVPGKGKDAIKYDGQLKKDAIVTFLSQAATPNPDPAPKKAKASSKSDKKKASKASSSFAKSSKSQASAQAETDAASQTAETLEDESQPTASPHPDAATEDTQKPVKIPDIATPIPSLAETIPLQQKCLNTKAGTCILALPPASNPYASTEQALASLSEIHHKHATANRKLFPFFQLPASNPTSASLIAALNLDASTTQLIATNGKRAWYRQYPSATFTLAEIEDWIDSIRMGDGAKSKLPAELIVDAAELPAEPIEVKVDSTSDPEDIMAQLKQQLPEGVEFELEEIEDGEYERILAEASRGAAKREKAEAAATARDEL
ncbi:hypothetical protein BDY17DRAFT_346582 [Neohortaea acidophila]|uniref:protein disulfide-isomerase n=1 Tax=Neohortaea acidophila TaxID=245834 RepID=A0A6A6PR97_9PEZI|nr:uncharacterized protein BDY17DRAFT_346582 [Neohortaea acidophila]KAF2482512.1 hypothetical protein BDY17DRAFT_346582 [Neohortaea acidophila]